MNNCVLIGNLGADPKSAFTSEGTQVVNFSLAFNSYKKEQPNWIKTVCFGKLAEVAEKYLHKGAKVAVNGKLDQNNWTDDNNQKRSNYRLIANQISFIKTDGRGFENGDNADQQEPSENEALPF